MTTTPEEAVERMVELLAKRQPGAALNLFMTTIASLTAERDAAREELKLRGPTSMTTTPTRATRLADAGLPASAYVVAKYHNRSVFYSAELMAAILELAEAVAEVKHERCDQIAPMTTVEIQAIVRRLGASTAARQAEIRAGARPVAPGMRFKL